MKRLLLVLWALATFGCSHSVQTNPVAAVADYGLKVTQIAQSLQHALIDAEAQGVVSADKIKEPMRYSILLGRKVQELADALTAIDKLPVGDLSRASKLEQAGVLLGAANELVFHLASPIDDPTLRGTIMDLAAQISNLLITIGRYVPVLVAPAGAPA